MKYSIIKSIYRNKISPHNFKFFDKLFPKVKMLKPKCFDIQNTKYSKLDKNIVKCKLEMNQNKSKFATLC